MLRGNWHIVAIAITICLMAKFNDYYFLFVVFIIWLIFLYSCKTINLQLLILTLFASLFFFYYVPSPRTLAYQATDLDIEITDFSGRIKGPIVQTDKTIQFTFQDDRFHNKLNVVHFIDNKYEGKLPIQSLKYGAYCHVTGILELPEMARNPYQFDYQMFLLKKGISHQL